MGFVLACDRFSVSFSGLFCICSFEFTGEAFTDVLKARGVAISMDGKGAWRNNIFVERLWSSVKYEEVYLHAHDSVSQAKARLAWCIDFTTPPDRNRRSTSGPEFYFATLPRSNRQHER